MLKMEIDTKDLERVLVRMPPALKEEMGDGLDHASRKFLKVFAQRRLSAPPWHESTPAQGVVKNRAGFFRGFKRIFSFSGTQSGMGVTILTDSKLAAAMESGQTISGGVPVPLSARGREVLTAKGRIKKSLWNLKRRRNIRPIKFKGQVYLTKVTGREVLPLFVIKPQVKVDPHLEFYGTFNAMRSELYTILAKSFIKGVRKATENG